MGQGDPVEPVARGPAGLDHRHVASTDEDRSKVASPVFDRAKRASDRRRSSTSAAPYDEVLTLHSPQGGPRPAT
jgi:hypothetical protein